VKIIVINTRLAHVHRVDNGFRFSLNIANKMGPLLMDAGWGDVVLTIAGRLRGSVPTVIEDIAVCTGVTTGHLSYRHTGPKFTVTRSVVLNAEYLGHLSMGSDADQQRFADFLSALAKNSSELKTGLAYEVLSELHDVMVGEQLSIHCALDEIALIESVNTLIGGPNDDAT
jgi:hypothetical protein